MDGHRCVVILLLLFLWVWSVPEVNFQKLEGMQLLVIEVFHCAYRDCIKGVPLCL